ncbi:hypothetical protein BN2476_630121 [Paraburkholderia piptadeniae]|uniref:Transposase n=1 Tax=Paraburkholderia piptadeniae TaxID=1701573 RepID=A0A1N7SLX2_9BURK|nr:hypothetical protein BN2476_630121 [Paraburkholderia piptadeniae]
MRTLTIVDNYTRECLAIDVKASLRGEDVVAALDRITSDRPLPRFIKRRQRVRIHLEGAGPMGIRERRRNRLLTSRQADR